MTPIFVAAPQASLRAGYASVLGMICKVSFPTFLDTLGLEEEKGLFTACALMGTLALNTVAVTALAGAGVPVVLW